MPPGRRPAATRRPGWPADRADRHSPFRDGSKAPPTGGASSCHRPPRAPARAVAGRRRRGEHAARDRAGDWLLVDPTVTAGRGVARSSSFANRTASSSRSSAWRPARATACRSPTATWNSPRTRPGCVSDASTAERRAAGFGEPIDSRRYGPVPLELLVGRAWFRYWPWRRIGRIGPAVRARPPRSSRPRLRRPAPARPPGSPRRRPPARRGSGTSASGSRPPGPGPISANAGQDVDPRLAGVAHLLVAGVEREAQRGRVAALGLAALADLGHPRGHLVGLEEHVVELVGVLDRVAGGARRRCRRR